jgi:hypothetical protein
VLLALCTGGAVVARARLFCQWRAVLQRILVTVTRRSALVHRLCRRQLHCRGSSARVWRSSAGGACCSATRIVTLHVSARTREHAARLLQHGGLNGTRARCR